MGKLKGKAEQVKGKAKEKTGDMTGDESMEMKGKAEQAKGKVEESAADAAHRMKRMTDRDR
ncbi:CsbD family protein [Streptomyces bambusae]|uniref:CsbD family protein n=1 Tax=Streptomyces bambusae TaxID=1550616 RepID=UPI001D00129E|nr:CsbD family protein [Streptomyces bambusae]MCB5169499.1 CsbD family protein [Streptomyces bambusae]